MFLPTLRISSYTYLCISHYILDLPGLSTDSKMATPAARSQELLARLPKTYRKLTLHTLTKDFSAATRVDEVPTSQLVDVFVHGKGLLLLKVLYAGVNASDVMYSNGFYNPGKKTPYDTGMEGIGEVIAVSPDVTSHKVGDFVMCSMNAGGWYGEYRVVPARIVMRAGNDPRYLTLLIRWDNSAGYLD